MKLMGKVAVFGGTFSPVHNGHIRAMEAYANAVKPDILYIIPTAIPPHKQRDDSATDAQRLAMLNLVAEELCVPCDVFVSDMEILRGGKSYTSDTVQALYAISEEVCIFCGTDMILTLDQWHETWRIFKLASVAYMQREGDFRFNDEVEQKVKQLTEDFNARFIKIPAVPYEVSSSEIRTRLRRGEDISDLVPSSVAKYILREGLYVDAK